jgi:energy-coupling factor transporter ATP-binding protein EcfA2
MQLADYQSKYLDELYNKLVIDNHQFILFTGQKGSGKSVVVEELANLLMENWQVFLISGTGVESPPYYTWYSAANTFSNHRGFQINEITFGVSFEPIGIPVGFEMGLSLSASESVLNSNEQSIIKSIRNRIGNNEHILFIADNYSLWDSASQVLLMKIIAGKTNILGSKKRIHFILVDLSSSHINVSVNNEFFKISIHDISLENIKQVISQQPYINALELYDLEKIIQFTGFDLRLINLAVSYHQGNTESSGIRTLEDLLERRISDISKEQHEVCQTLERVSIINSFFSEKEAAYLLDKEPVHTERILDEAANLQLIRKRHEYDFPNSEIQKYFEARLDSERKYLHYRFAQYLQESYPEDYFSRASHLYLSEKAYSEHNILEAAYLMTIEIVRRQEITNGAAESNLEEKLAEIISCLPSEIVRIVKSNISLFLQGNVKMNQCNYVEAILCFSNLQLVYATKVFSIEVTRLIVLSLVQLADDLYEIKQKADELYDMITDSALHEDEVWCRAALILLEVYGDRHICDERFQILNKGFDIRIRKHMYQSAFRALNYKHASKAALFFNALIAIKLTEESCEYYRAYNSIPNLYFSLCNNAANRIICGEYKEASDRLQECKDIISSNKDINFPSIYKIENNDIINDFLQSEGILFDYQSRRMKKELIIIAANEAINRLQQIVGQQGSEVTHVIEFNLLSILLLIDDRDNAYRMIQKFEKEYNNLDAYYKYYYHNACISYSLLEGEYDKAASQLSIIEKFNVPLLSKYAKILNRRNYILHELVEEKFEGNGFDYNYEFIRRDMRRQDISASFWGRGLLLSDLQFLSF